MAKNTCLIYFFIDSEGDVRINHLNNTAEEILDMNGYHDGYPILLFAYCYKTRNLYVTNADDERLRKILIAYRDNKSSKSGSSEEMDLSKQMAEASRFLKSKFSWKGEILSREALESEIIEKTTKDFELVWNYLRLIFGSMRLDPIDLPVYIVENLEHKSMFVPIDEILDIGEKIYGPAIVLRKTNSMYFMSEALIYQYVLNLHGIVDFSPGVEETYLKDAKEFIDKTLISFLRNNNLKEQTMWYVGKKDGRIYLNKNDYKNNSAQLIENEGYTAVVTFEYVIVEDSRYIIFNDIEAGSINDSHLLKSMLEFIGENLSYIGHIDIDGSDLENPPIYLFDGLKSPYIFLKATNLTVWILIKTILSILYDFDPRDILIIKGEFDESFAFRYLDPLNSEDKSIISEYLSFKDYREPIMLWNSTSYDSVIGKWNQFIKEYLRFIKGEKFNNDDENMKEELSLFKEKVLQNAENRFAMETLVGLLCEENPHIHQYNVFNIFSKIIGLTGIVTEDVLERSPDFGDEETMAILTEVQTSLFFLTLKSMATLCNIKYGIDFTVDGEIEKGDIVLDSHSNCLYEIHSVLLEPSNQTDDNPEGITYLCKNLICASKDVRTLGEVQLFHFGFLDDEKYNEKRASKINKHSQQFGSEYYKKMLQQFLRNKKRPNPLDYVEDADFPSFDALLTMQRKEYNRNEADTILENMLNDCRKVKSYGN